MPAADPPDLWLHHLPSDVFSKILNHLSPNLSPPHLTLSLSSPHLLNSILAHHSHTLSLQTLLTPLAPWLPLLQTLQALHIPLPPNPASPYLTSLPPLLSSSLTTLSFPALPNLLPCLHRAYNLRTLTVQLLAPSSFPSFFAALSSFIHLETLSLHYNPRAPTNPCLCNNYEYFSPPSKNVLAASLPSLSSLHFTCPCPLTASSHPLLDILPSLSSVSHVHISISSSPLPPHLLTLIYPLASVAITTKPHASPHFAQELAVHLASRVVRLHVHKLLDAPQVRALAVCHRLHSLHLGVRPDAHEAVASLLPHLKALRVLELRMPTEVERMEVGAADAVGRNVLLQSVEKVNGLRELRLTGGGWRVMEVGQLLEGIAGQLNVFEVWFGRDEVAVEEVERLVNGLRGAVNLRELKFCGTEGIKLRGKRERVAWVRLRMGQVKKAGLGVDVEELERRFEKLLATVEED